MALRISNIKNSFFHIKFKGKNYFKRNFISKSSSVENGTNCTNSDISSINNPSKKIVTPLPSLTQPITDLPEVQYAQPRSEGNVTQITTLSNGLKVASEKRLGQFCTVGVVINSGSRYEFAYPSGISHFLEKLAFNSTENFSSKDEILKELEKHCGIYDCQSSRDTFIYAVSCNSRGIESIIRLLGDVILRPKFVNDEINLAKQAIRFELNSYCMRPEQEPILMDMIHAAAYKDNTLGFPKICPADSIDIIDQNIIFDYLRNYHSPERMVVAGVGVDHDILVKNVEKYFVKEKPIWEQNNSGKKIKKFINEPTALYTGGVMKEKCDIPIYTASGLPPLVHIVIGLESCSHQDKDFIATCVLNTMMGGGGSFSAGGPGKGMYTRLYTNVLSRYHWMYSATAYNNSYSDTGLFCIHASAPPNNVREMVEVIIHELINMASKPSKQELRRSKTQLQSMLVMNLETRPVVCEDIGRQVLAIGCRKRPELFINEIEKIEITDIKNVALRLLSSPISLAARGNIKDLPSLRDIQENLTNGHERMSSHKHFLFK